jgi:hypothetical protein
VGERAREREGPVVGNGRVSCSSYTELLTVGTYSFLLKGKRMEVEKREGKLL